MEEKLNNIKQILNREIESNNTILEGILKISHQLDELIIENYNIKVQEQEENN